jgi:hypothetical protein
MMRLSGSAALAVIAAATGAGAALACTPVYAPPEASGLQSGPAYPQAGDVCRVIGENALTSDYLDDSATLVGCPVHEKGAIADRRTEGGRVVDLIGDWVLISVPNG